MNDNVVQFGDYLFKAKGKRWPWDQDRCPHKHIELDDNGEIVTCTDCNKQLTAYWALRHITQQWADHARKAKAHADEVSERVKQNISLLAAQRVEKAWRSRKMVPTCPHCSKGIMPDDGFGSAAINREIEMRRRSAGKNEGQK